MIRVGRMNQQRPDAQILVGETRPRPMLAAIGGPIRAVLRADKDRVGRSWMEGDRLHVAIVGQTAGQLFELLFADLQPEDAVDLAALQPVDPGIDMGGSPGGICHQLPPNTSSIFHRPRHGR